VDDRRRRTGKGVLPRPGGQRAVPLPGLAFRTNGNGDGGGNGGGNGAATRRGRTAACAADSPLDDPVDGARGRVLIFLMVSAHFFPTPDVVAGARSALRFSRAVAAAQWLSARHPDEPWMGDSW
jgi:hypothetical protein